MPAEPRAGTQERKQKTKAAVVCLPDRFDGLRADQLAGISCDLFASEVVSPQEHIIVGQRIVLFTDLKGSTAMYCELGDARTSVVRDHFQLRQSANQEHHGAWPVCASCIASTWQEEKPT